MPRNLVFLPLTALWFLLCWPVTAQQTFKIERIEFQGLKRFSTEEMIATAGLKVGDSFDVASLDAAAQKLADTGYFKHVGYQTKASRDQITITFQVEETVAGTSRVVFDNFIWFTDTELIAAVQRDVPSFSGTAPDNGDIVQRITKSLERFLHENKIDAEVNYMVSQDSPASLVQEHVFSVLGVPMPICTLHFPGARNVEETKLIERSRPLLGADYSVKFVALFASNNLLPIYRERGQLKAEFSPPLAKPEASATCKSGVELSLPVDEGQVYSWDHADWSGIKALNVQELNAVIGIQAGQPANGVKLDKVATAIGQAYGRKGYLLTRVTSQPQFDDAAQKVVYKIHVVEGPQFRMGKLIASGFSPDLIRALNERWRLKSGDIFDQGYLQEFAKKDIGEVLRNTFLERRSQGRPAPNLKVGTNVNRETLTVDVSIELTN